MGEYANHKGSRIKIGTCESMYYLRFSQLREVDAVAGSVNPVTHANDLLFRFPLPWEDGTEPGGYESSWPTGVRNGFALEGFLSHEDYSHGMMQVKPTSRDSGYLLGIPCPEGTRIDGIRYGRNGGNKTLYLVGQRLWEGLLVPVVECVGCGNLYRLPKLDLAQPLIDAARAYADDSTRRERIYDAEAPEPTDAKHWRIIADRIEDGFNPEGAWFKTLEVSA